MYHHKSLKKGDTAEERAVLFEAAAANGDPSTAAVNCSKFSEVVLLYKSTGGTSASFQVWTYYAEADIWLTDLTLGTAGVVTVVTATNDGIAKVAFDVTGAELIYVELTAVNGATASAWVIGVNPNLATP